ncbi:hypothetical protein H6775_02965 [Candidatus Nomurabacteria bacterium]|nr:hypothetical protein [Candidatus Nomurabacteria bacterium]
MTQIIIFSVSIVLMVSIVGIRMLEIKRGQDIVSQSFRKSGDKIVLTVWNWVRNILSIVNNSISNFFKNIFRTVAHLMVDLWEIFVRKSAKYIDSIRGKGVLKNKGSASFFISSLQEHKEEIRH